MGHAWLLVAMLLAAAPGIDHARAGDIGDIRDIGEQQPAATSPDAADMPVDLGWATDRTRRITLPLEVAGSGPFAFVVDTGAERSIVATELARQLGMVPGRRVVLTTIAGRHETDSVEVRLSDITRRSVRTVETPLLPRHSLGAEGLIGVDLLEKLSIRLDFRRSMAVVRSGLGAGMAREAASGDIVVRARRRAGRLILADVMVDGVRTAAVIDSGAERSVVNPALSARLVRRGQTGTTAVLTSVTGEQVPVSIMLLGRLDLGEVDVTSLPAAVADSPVFGALGLDDRPAMLLGIDVLSLFDHVDLDFRNRKVAFSRD